MDVLEAIRDRVSAIRLSEPGPSRSELEAILSAGLQVPDHGRLAPVRLVVIEGERRELLAGAYEAACKRTRSDADAAVLEGERRKAFRAPTIVIVAAQLERYHKVPVAEQLSAVAAGAQNIFLAARSLGYGVMWKTGAPVYDPEFAKAVGAPGLPIVGMLYIGTSVAQNELRPSNFDQAVAWL